MNNWLKDALTVDVIAPAGGVASSEVLISGGIKGVTATAEGAGNKVAVLTEAVFSLPKATSHAWTEGMPLFWDQANAKATPLPVGPHIGEAESAALLAATTGRVIVRPSCSPLAATPKTLTLTDDDNAAATGTALMVAVDGKGAYLASANAGGADAHFKDADAADAVVVDYNANPAANLGAVQVYVDEDAALGSRFLCVSPLGLDLFVPTVGGRFVRIAHDADAATSGVALYFDDDGADAAARLLFVSPTNEDGTETTSLALAAAA